jgi:hypothetical protein
VIAEIVTPRRLAGVNIYGHDSKKGKHKTAPNGIEYGVLEPSGASTGGFNEKVFTKAVLLVRENSESVKTIKAEPLLNLPWIL